MKIIFLLPDLRHGGAQKMIINMANEFATRNHQVTLLTVNDSVGFQDCVSDKVELSKLGRSRTIYGLFALICELKKRQADVVISALVHVNLLALIAKKLTPNLKTKYIITERNLFSLRMKNSNKLDVKITPFLVKALYKTADKVVGISDGVTNDIKKVANLDDKSVATIYNPVITQESKKLYSEDIIDPWINSANRPLLVASGRLVQQKDYPTLLRALSILKKTKSASLMILGEGQDSNEIKNLAGSLGLNNDIYFTGFVSNPLAYMKQADLFVISSRWEGFGNVIVEALFCGLPIVATDCQSGPSEILEQGNFGTLVPVENEKMLAEALETALSKKVDSKLQLARAMNFNVERICDKYEKLILKIMDDN